MSAINTNRVSLRPAKFSEPVIRRERGHAETCTSRYRLLIPIWTTNDGGDAFWGQTTGEL